MTSRLGVKERHAVKSFNHLGDNCIQNFHLGRYIVGYTVGNLVLRRRVSSLKFLMLFINIRAFHGAIYVQIRNSAHHWEMDLLFISNEIKHNYSVFG